ncbi:hypothetical protein BDW02DRAFT_569822, partial [Decorospora gaudefroyi]
MRVVDYAVSVVGTLTLTFVGCGKGIFLIFSDYIACTYGIYMDITLKFSNQI